MPEWLNVLSSKLVGSRRFPSFDADVIVNLSSDMVESRLKNMPRYLYVINGLNTSKLWVRYRSRSDILIVGPIGSPFWRFPPAFHCRLEPENESSLLTGTVSLRAQDQIYWAILLAFFGFGAIIATFQVLVGGVSDSLPNLAIAVGFLAWLEFCLVVTSRNYRKVRDEWPKVATQIGWKISTTE